MSERITLTGDELDELAYELQCRFGPYTQAIGVGNSEVWLLGAQALINRLNELRKPDPIGTVRADDDGNVAIKVNDHASDQWYVYRLQSARCHSFESTEYLSTWPVAHKPSDVGNAS